MTKITDRTVLKIKINKYVRIMKLTVVTLFLTLLHLQAGEMHSQTSALSLSLKNVTMEEAVNTIEQETLYSFLFTDKAVDAGRKVSIHVNNGEITDILNQMLKDTDIGYRIMDRQIILARSKSFVFQQENRKRITGTVVDEKGEPVIGANIIEKGVTASGTVTDVDGNFSLSVQPNTTLTVSYIGYVTQEIAVGNRSELRIALIEDSRMLEEVVVVGYGTQKKTHLSGAVSTVTSKALENRSVSNVNLVLQGLASNVNIAVGSGNPTSAPGINVRGYTSINGGEALILVDNVPVDAGELGRMVNPADIESVSILKDAASAAIYGARAAFGVVLITTKSAKTFGKLEVNGEYTYSVRKEIATYKHNMDLVNYMETVNTVSGDATYYNAAQIDYARKRMQNPSLPEVLTPYDPVNPALGNNPARWDCYAVTDWHKLISVESPVRHNANVNIAQRTERLSYAMSARYFSEDGLFIGEKPLQRYNFRGTADYKLTKHWTAGAAMLFSRTVWNTPYIIGSGGVGGAPESFASFPYLALPVRMPSGVYSVDAAMLYGQLEEGGRYIQKINESQLSFNTKYDIIDDVFSIKGDATFRFHNNYVDKYRRAVWFEKAPGALENRVTPGAGNDASLSNYTVLNVYGDFHKTFAGKHAVQALAGFNQEHTYNSGFSVWQDGLIYENLPTLALTNGPISRSENKGALSIRGVFGRLNYTFDDRYIVEFNGRYDGTSRYAKGQRFGFFPSGTGAWILSNESFFESVKDALKISFLKFRGSYGVLGNQASGGWYPYFSNMSNPETIGQWIDNTRPQAIYPPGSEAASNLTWERVRTVNAGVNLNLFNNRLTLTFDKYTRYTEGMLAPVRPMPAQFGTSISATNSADLKTKGWELEAGWNDKVSLAGSPLSYSVRVLLADARAWITKYDNPTRTLGAWREGQEVGELWGYEVPGLFQSDAEVTGWHDQAAIRNPARSDNFSAGDMKFNDLNGDGKINSGDGTENKPGDRRIIGNSQMRLPYSFDLSADWKGFDLRLFFQGLGKCDWYPTSGRAADQFWSNYIYSWRTASIYIDDRWRPETPDGYYPRMYNNCAQGYAQEWRNINTRYLQDISYLRLKNLTLGYTLPKTLTGKWGIGHLRVYFSGENLWTLNHIFVNAIDPETVMGGYAEYPLQKIFSFGLNVRL